LTGFVVFFYEGSGLQIFASMVISILFFGCFSVMKPYLMPSNNTFAIFVHFQVTFTLACTLLLRMNERFSNEDRSAFQIDSESLSYALLISNASVLVFGVILILRACFNTSEGDFLDAGFDDEIQEVGSGEKKEDNNFGHETRDFDPSNFQKGDLPSKSAQFDQKQRKRDDIEDDSSVERKVPKLDFRGEEKQSTSSTSKNPSSKKKKIKKKNKKKIKKKKKKSKKSS